jgi:hypothetical protein
MLHLTPATEGRNQHGGGLLEKPHPYKLQQYEAGRMCCPGQSVEVCAECELKDQPASPQPPLDGPGLGSWQLWCMPSGADALLLGGCQAAATALQQLDMCVAGELYNIYI